MPRREGHTHTHTAVGLQDDSTHVQGHHVKGREDLHTHAHTHTHTSRVVPVEGVLAAAETRESVVGNSLEEGSLFYSQPEDEGNGPMRTDYKTM